MGSDCCSPPASPASWDSAFPLRGGQASLLSRDGSTHQQRFLWSSEGLWGGEGGGMRLENSTWKGCPGAAEAAALLLRASARAWAVPARRAVIFNSVLWGRLKRCCLRSCPSPAGSRLQGGGGALSLCTHAWPQSSVSEEDVRAALQGGSGGQWGPRGRRGRPAVTSWKGEAGGQEAPRKCQACGFGGRREQGSQARLSGEDGLSRGGGRAVRSGEA